MKEEKISVIVPAYNVERYLSDCLNSILEQEYKNLEIILINNGSNDRTGEICEEYAKKDKRICVIHEEKAGVGLARNIGLEKVTGKYISFIDSDDYVHPSFIKRLYDILTENNADIAECSYYNINEKDKEHFFEIIDTKRNESKGNLQIYDNKKAISLVYDANVLEYIHQIILCNKLYKKELWDDIRFSMGRLHEDDNTTYKVLYKANKIVDTREILYGYVQSDNSIMRKSFKEKRIDDSLAAYDDASKFFEKYGETDMQGMARRRYLELCIELSYKVEQSDLPNKEDCKTRLKTTFIEGYNNFIDLVKLSKPDENQKKIICVLDKAYDIVHQNKGNLSDLWKQLSEIYYF